MSSNTSSLTYYSKGRRLTAYILLFLQLFLPISVSFSAVVHATEQESLSSNSDMMNTMSGIDALVNGNVPDPKSNPQEPVLNRLPVLHTEPMLSSPWENDSRGFFLPPVHDNTVRQDDILSALPTLGLPDTADEDVRDPETMVAQGVTQTVELLSNSDAVDASLGYARSLGENIVNQQITDWLNQYGKARVQFSTDKTGEADLLLPLVDKANSLFFSQVGIRATEDRNTTNLGLGYRQYQDDWMWGVNSFYDYDITGGNSRIGIGSELWLDYFKFAGNGYFRLTDWHQSSLHEMRDYDERPANGFDLRAEGYLPSYPQLGAFAKYEKYFGDGININNGSVSAGNLKNDPAVSTLGVSYTPFPLMTVKGETSRGDSSDSRLGVELTYRFGVSLSRQLSSDYVDLMRSLAGNRYDFVDRNYNIVMQYRKQELLTIALPNSTTAEAAQMLPVTATVLKSKYGLSSTEWFAPEIMALGGSIVITSANTINLTLPAYVFKAGSIEPQQYKLSAIGTDKEGNKSNTAVMWVNVIPSQETITSLTVTPNNTLLANNNDFYTATALLKNEKGEVLANKEVTFTVSDFSNNNDVTLMDLDGNVGNTITVLTDSTGRAIIRIKSKVAGQGTLTATMRNGNSRSEAISFKADISTAKIMSLLMVQDESLADGVANNIAQAIVKDYYGNLVEGFTLTSNADNGATVVTPTQISDVLGQVDIEFNNVTAGNSILTVNGSGTQKTVTGKFVADISSAQIASVVIVQNNVIANGKDKNIVTVTVKDINGNVVANAPVTITVPSPAQYSTQPNNGMTDSSGKLTVSYTSTKAGTENYGFQINSSQDTAALTFKADSSNPSATKSTLEAQPVKIVADGIETSTLKLALKDNFENPISGQVVAFSTSLANVTISSVTDNHDGSYTAILSGTKVGQAPIAVSVNGQALAVNPITVILTASRPSAIASTIKVDQTSYMSGDKVKVTVTLRDNHGNLSGSQILELTEQAVTVPNMFAPEEAWVEVSEGVYTRNYKAKTAGQSLQAKLKLSDWGTTVLSTPYSITAGASVASKSEIKVDKGTYAAGDPITVTVTLRDEQGNITSITPTSLLLSGVDVQSASTPGAWVANTDGTYSNVYTATTVGSDFIATLTLTIWGGESVKSNKYAVTAGTSVAANSSVQVNKGTYSAGEEVTVTVKLVDAYNNPVINKQADIAGHVTVPNTSAKDASAWVGDASGSYTKVYIAEHVDAGLKAKLAMADWGGSIKESAPYNITAGSAVATKSTIKVNSTLYTTGTEMTVTVKLIDQYGNTQRGQAAKLNGNESQVNVENAEAKSGSLWVEDATDGIYSRTYIAKTVGQNLTAKLTLKPEWAGDTVSSTPYQIKVGNADKDKSTIKVNASKYISGESILVTVELKDSEGNIISGDATTLTGGVAVEKATLNGSWSETSTAGTYQANYIAGQVGDGLKATLNLNPSWAPPPTSTLYSIIAGKPDQSKSKIIVDKADYISGSPIKVTVKLRDAQGNAITGEGALLTTQTVVVPKIETKASGYTWVETSAISGDYVQTFTAKETGTGLKATLTLTGWAPAESADYKITAGQPDKLKSSISVDQNEYISGNPIIATVKLRDAQGNAITGESGLLTTTSVAVPYTETKVSGYAWVETPLNSGDYTQTFVAEKVGENLKATLTLTSTGWGSAKESNPYAIKVGQPDQGKSSIKVDKTSYVSGESIEVTVTLKDGKGNVITGKSDLLTESSVKVPNTETKTSGYTWVETAANSGIYKQSFVAKEVKANLKATLTLAGWSPAESSEYSIVAGAAVAGEIKVDKLTYASGDKIKVEVKLRDANGNSVGGLVSDLAVAGVVIVDNGDDDGAAWVESSGIYTKEYAAGLIGSNLTAKLKLTSAWATVESDKYAITAGIPASGSTILVDKTVYNAGDDIKVTVKLEDAKGNKVTNAANLLTTDTVKVGNTVVKDSGYAWTEDASSPGTYTQTFIAKTAAKNLIATLMFSGWGTPKESGVYEIKAGIAAEDDSTILVDKSVYTARENIEVTIELVDAYGNPVLGQSSKLAEAGVVNVENAIDGTVQNWTESASGGTYTRSYIAKTAGKDLKATLKLNSFEKTSTLYKIQADQSSAWIKLLEPTSNGGRANNQVQNVVTATVVDADENPVSGIIVDFTSSINTTPNTGSGTTDEGGKVTYNIRSTVAEESEVTALIRGSLDAPTKTKVFFIGDRYTAEIKSLVLQGDITSKLANGTDSFDYTLTVLDAFNNAVTDPLLQLAFITNRDPITVDDNVLVVVDAQGPEAFDANGKMTVKLNSTLYTAKNVLLTAKIGTAEKNADKTVSFAGVPAIDYMLVNKGVRPTRFPAESKFPSTGLDGAQFVVTLRNADKADYTWSIDQTSWVSIDQTGEVTLTGKPDPSKKTVKVTATPKTPAPGVNTLTYEFTVSKWFITAGYTDKRHYEPAVQYCQSVSARMPDISDLTNAVMDTVNLDEVLIRATRTVNGRLWSEWGTVSSDPYGVGKWNVSSHWTTGVAPVEPGTGKKRQFAVYHSNGNRVVLLQEPSTGHSVDMKDTYITCVYDL